MSKALFGLLLSIFPSCSFIWSSNLMAIGVLMCTHLVFATAVLATCQLRAEWEEHCLGVRPTWIQSRSCHLLLCGLW